MDDHLHLVLPPIVRLFDPKDAPLPICQEALVTVADLANKLDLTEYVGRIMHPLVSGSLSPASWREGREGGTVWCTGAVQGGW